MKRAETSALFYFFITKWNFLGIMYNEGISSAGDLLDTGIMLGAIEKTGNTHLFEDIKLGVGREAAKAFIKENKEVATKIDAAIRAQIAAGITSAPEADAPEETEEE